MQLATSTCAAQNTSEWPLSSRQVLLWQRHHILGKPWCHVSFCCDVMHARKLSQRAVGSNRAAVHIAYHSPRHNARDGTSVRIVLMWQPRRARGKPWCHVQQGRAKADSHRFFRVMAVLALPKLLGMWQARELWKRNDLQNKCRPAKVRRG